MLTEKQDTCRTLHVTLIRHMRNSDISRTERWCNQVFWTLKGLLYRTAHINFPSLIQFVGVGEGRNIPKKSRKNFKILSPIRVTRSKFRLRTHERRHSTKILSARRRDTYDLCTPGKRSVCCGRYVVSNEMITNNVTAMIWRKTVAVSSETMSWHLPGENKWTSMNTLSQ